MRKTIVTPVYIFILMIMILVSGCGVFTDRSDEYQHTGSLSAIKVPNDISKDTAPLGQLYEIPVIPPRPLDEFELETDDDVPRPMAMSQESENGRVKIQKVGENQWILLEAPASQIWPLAQSFFVTEGFGVVETNPRVGLVETSWLAFDDSPGKQTRFRIRIEKGIRVETTEVHILAQEAAVETKVTDLAWPARSNNSESEKWLIDELSQVLFQQIDNRAASLQGQSVGGDVKATLKMDKDEPVLQLFVSKERTAATLLHATTKEGFKSWGSFGDADILHIGYNYEPKKAGWWKRKFGGGSPKLPEKSPVETEALVSALSTKSSVKQLFEGISGVNFVDSSVSALKLAHPEQHYLLRIRPSSNGFEVRLRNARGEALPLKQAKSMLAILRRNLI